MKRYLARMPLPLTLIFLLLTHIAGYINLPYLDGLERQLYDTRVRLTAPGGVDPDIVIAAIDEYSLEKQGHWPWTREKLAMLVDRLFEYGAAVVSFDMVFAERDVSADVALLREFTDEDADAAFLQRLGQLEPRLNRDHIFAEALGRGPTVLGYYFDTDPSTVLTTGVLPYPAFELSDEIAGAVHLPTAYGYGANLEELMAGAYSAGFISNPLIDEDGIVRRVPLLHRHGSDVYESLSLATAATYLDDIALPIFVDTPLLIQGYPPFESLELAGRSIPIDAEGAVMVPFRGPSGSFPYVSASRIIDGTVSSASLLKDAIVVVGATAPGLLDIRSTPFSSVFPGPEIHANVMAGLLNGNFKWHPPYTVAAELIAVAFFGLLMVLLLPLLSPVWSTIASMAIFAAAVLMNGYLWEVKLHVLPLAATLLVIAGVYMLNMVFGYFFETRMRSHMNDLFGQYVPPDLVREMSNDPENYSLASEKRELTVLFSDVRDFTAISERLDAVDLSDMMNRYLTPMTRIIHEGSGTIDKYMGDAIMAFWGAPVKDPEHATNAIRSALAMLERLETLNDEFEAKGMPRIQIGIGLNTGDMSVGNMGSRFRRAYTVMGDAVNLGSRLEGLTKAYGAWLIVSEFTRERAPGFTYRWLDQVRVKGKLEPVTIFEVIGETSKLGPAEVEIAQKFDRFSEAYLAGDWGKAEDLLSELPESEQGTKLCRLYRERIRTFRQDPPGPEWDGVFEHTKK